MGQRMVTTAIPWAVEALVNVTEHNLERKLGDECFIAGGAITRSLAHGSGLHGGDVDVWVDKGLYDEVCKKLGYKSSTVPWKNSAGRDHSKFTVNGQVIDIIPLDMAKYYIQDVFDYFDMSVCQFAYDGLMTYMPGATDDLLFRHLRVLRPTFASRIYRYINTYKLRPPNGVWPEGISPKRVSDGVPGYTVQKGEDCKWLT